MEAPLPTQCLTTCELCWAPADVLCPSDDAFLCRRCDCLVHSANFLVARHHRTFLCRYCACPTASGASGASLPAASPLCLNCSPFNLAELGCSSRSESSNCSELTSDDDSERESLSHSYNTPAATASLLHRHKRPLPLQLSSQSVSVGDATSDSMSGIEEEPSSAGTSPTSSCSSMKEADGSALSHAKSTGSFYESAKG